MYVFNLMIESARQGERERESQCYDGSGNNSSKKNGRENGIE